MDCSWQDFVNLSADERALFMYFCTLEDMENELPFLELLEQHEQAFAQVDLIYERLSSLRNSQAPPFPGFEASFSHLSTIIQADLPLSCLNQIEDQIQDFFCSKMETFREFLDAICELNAADIFQQVLSKQDSILSIYLLEYLETNKFSHYLDAYVALTGLPPNPEQPDIAKVFHNLQSIENSFEKQVKTVLVAEDVATSVESLKQELTLKILKIITSFQAYWVIKGRELSDSTSETSETPSIKIELISENNKQHLLLFNIVADIIEFRTKVLKICGPLNEFVEKIMPEISDNPAEPTKKQFDVLQAKLWSSFVPTFSRFVLWKKNLDPTEKNTILDRSNRFSPPKRPQNARRISRERSNSNHRRRKTLTPSPRNNYFDTLPAKRRNNEFLSKSTENNQFQKQNPVMSYSKSSPVSPTAPERRPHPTSVSPSLGRSNESTGKKKRAVLRRALSVETNLPKIGISSSSVSERDYSNSPPPLISPTLAPISNSRPRTPPGIGREPKQSNYVEFERARAFLPTAGREKRFTPSPELDKHHSESIQHLLFIRSPSDGRRSKEKHTPRQQPTEKIHLYPSKDQKSSIRSLVSSLCHNKIGTNSIPLVMVALPHFVPPMDLLSSIEEIIKVLSNFSNENDVQVPVRISSFLKQFITFYYREFFSCEKNESILREFIEKHFVASPEIKGFLMAHLSTEKEVYECWRRISEQRRCGSGLLLLGVSSLSLAEHLTLMDQKHLSEVPISEFHQLNWTFPEKSPSLTKLATYSNSLVFRFAYEIVDAGTSKASALLLIAVIKVGKKLLKMRNFNSLLLVHLTLSLVEIDRLTKSWKLVPKKYRIIKDQIAAIFSPAHSFAEYRSQTDNGYPFIPCREVLLQDLLYVSENYPNFENDVTLNTQKLLLMGQLIYSCLTCMQIEIQVQQKIMAELNDLFGGDVDAVVSDKQLRDLSHEDYSSS